jgi:hypothetical protein
MIEARTLGVRKWSLKLCGLICAGNNKSITTLSKLAAKLKERAIVRVNVTVEFSIGPIAVKTMIDFSPDSRPP